jgi:TfoX/Sxy family transcriptional regulator of competence genes
MAYDEELANRIRELIAAEEGLTEMRMFGGLAFLLNGHMSVAVSSRGGLLLRVGREGEASALARPHASTPLMGERQMKGWVRVAPEGLRTKRQLAAWVARGVDVARSLPPKG